MTAGKIVFKVIIVASIPNLLVLCIWAIFIVSTCTCESVAEQFVHLKHYSVSFFCYYKNILGTNSVYYCCYYSPPPHSKSNYANMGCAVVEDYNEGKAKYKGKL